MTSDIVKRISNGELEWNDLLTSCNLDDSVIEYIDPEEQNYAMIAMKSKKSYIQDAKILYTHCEIHPSTIFGVLASCAPFPDHNQSPRNTYQCLDPNEYVKMSDGTQKKIKNIKIGDSVLTFNPTTFEITNTLVVNQFVRKNDFPVYKITTISGKTILATENHKFMTNYGWKMVGDIIKDDTIKIGISMKNNVIDNSKLDKNNILIDDVLFISKMSILDDKKNNKTKKYLKYLKSINIIPLAENNPKLCILAKIIGYLYSDGMINIYTKYPKKYDEYKSLQCAFDFGCLNDAIDFENDLKSLGFNKTKILEGTRQFTPQNSDRLQTHHTFTCIHNGSLPALLIALGVSYGKKTETNRNPISDWIINNNEYSKQFMKGFQGGDGCKIRWNSIKKKGYNFVCGETSQQINPKYLDSLTTFMNQCVKILRNNNIKTNNIVVHNVKDTENRLKVAFKIKDTQENLVNYFDIIGYAYCEKKNNDSYKIIEYIKAKNIMFEKHKKTILEIRKLYDNGTNNKTISNITNKPLHVISDVLRSYKNNRKISTPNLKNFNIQNWLNETIEEKNNCIFIPVDKIENMDDCMVSDITVESENHSFITGTGFLSSNCAMVKQAIGIYAMNYDNRMDKSSYILNYPSRPLVDTRLMNFIQLNRVPSGCQIHVAIASFTGYNQEDSILINKGSIDRGMFSATIYHTEKDEDKNIIRDEIIRCKPDPTKTKCIKFGNYDKLNSQGFIEENELVENRDIIIAKIIPIKENRNDPTKTIKYEDQSKNFRTTEETYIDKNYTGRNGDGYNFAKVRVRTFRKPVIGDKFASRSAQKGTVGNIIPENDMPFTKDGLRPDIILNPHAIPSRMTIGQLKETILGKVLIELGMFGDGTSFGNLSVKTITEELQKLGYESYGNEVMYNGMTGEQMEMSIFFGPVFYQRLKHMVNDKQHSRAIGPMVNLTHQPAEGRARDGGFRIGEMERDVLCSHGMTKFTRERLFDVSDKYSVHVCKKCGMIACFNDGDKNRAYTNNDFSIHLCKTCGNKTDFSLVEMPYANKLLFQELQTINVVPRVITE